MGEEPEAVPAASGPVEIVADENVVLADAEGSRLPQAWAGRALYLGEAGCRNWLGVVHEPGYPLGEPSRFGLAKNRLAAVQGVTAATLVSLGPGDGLPDVPLAMSLRASYSRPEGPARPALRYIPVEICRPLLDMAIANLRPYADVPVGVHCDFEESHAVLAGALDRHARRPILFTLLGGTVGNLDNDEQSFFANLRGLMEHGDSVLVDVPLAGPAWTSTEEPRLNAATYSLAFRRFLDEPLRRLDNHGSRAEQHPSADGQGKFEDRMGFAHEHDGRTGAEVITVTDTRSGRRLLTFRRYRWSKLLNWFEGQGFCVSFAETSTISAADRFGMGVVLLTPL